MFDLFRKINSPYTDVEIAHSGVLLSLWRWRKTRSYRTYPSASNAKINRDNERLAYLNPPTSIITCYFQFLLQSLQSALVSPWITCRLVNCDSGRLGDIWKGGDCYFSLILIPRESGASLTSDSLVVGEHHLWVQSKGCGYYQNLKDKYSLGGLRSIHC